MTGAGSVPRMYLRSSPRTLVTVLPEQLKENTHRAGRLWSPRCLRGNFAEPTPSRGDQCFRQRKPESGACAGDPKCAKRGLERHFPKGTAK